MKILAIRGKNIASLEGEFSIDFTSEPLRSAGIFAISGATGSGKSSLLDTMCLALFARTPRTDQAKENEIWLRDVKDSTLRQSDPRILLRRGTATGYAKTDFVALNGKRYRAHWTVRRARDKESGALQDFRLSLFNLDTDTEEQGNKKELQLRITELIGLTFDQFTRSVLLAQNDFSTFLKADQSEKASLLEKLTGTELYSGISQLIYEKNATAKEAYEQIRARIDGVEILTNEEVTGIEQTKLVSEVALLSHQKEKTALEEKLNWFTALAEWQENARQAAREEAEATAAWQESEPRQSYLRQVDEVQDARTGYEAVKSTACEIELKKAQQEKNNELLLQAANTLEAVDKRQLQELQELQEAELLYQNTAPELQQARKLDVQLEESRRLVLETDARLQKATAERKERELGLQEIEKQVASISAELQSLARWKEQHQAKKLIAERCDSLLLQLDQAESVRRTLGIATRNVEQWKQTIQADEKQLNTKSDLLAAREKERQTQEQTLQTLEAQQQQTDYEALRCEMEHYQTKREEYAYEQALLTSKDITVLREKLSDGHPCPLCGSEYHPYAGADAQLHQSFSGVIEAVDVKLKELKQTESNYLIRQKKETEARQLHFKLHKEVTLLEKELAALTTGTALTRNRVVNEEESIRELNKTIRELINSVNELFEGDQWLAGWQSNPELFREKLIDFSCEWKKNKETLHEKEIGRERLLAEQNSFHAFLPSLQKREEEVLREYTDCKKQVSLLKKEREKILNGLQADQIEQTYKTKIEEKKQQVANGLATQNKASHTYEQAKGTATQIETDLQAATLKLKQQQEQFQAWLTACNTNRTEILTEEMLASLLSRETQWIKYERDALNLLYARRIETGAKLCEREEKLKQHESKRTNLQVEEMTPDLLQEAIAQNAAVLTEQNNQLNECLFKLRHHHENKEKIKNMEEELQTKQHISEQWARLNELAGSSDGGKFRRIAQGYTLDILLSYANIQLNSLTKRYRLERVPETLALQVIDRDMCDEVRTVHSLSGGESFLVSLALALGLSSLSSNRMKVESLFIDEGFGSLDMETLRMAMDALESLRTQGRKIGVISHVQEMTERIPVQIQVEKAGNGRSRIVVNG